MRTRMVVLALLCMAGSAAGQTAAARAALDSAALAWDAGDYPDALLRMQRILGGREASSAREAIALLTGEWFVAVQVSADARAPRWSPDGRFFAWETGEPGDVRTHVLAVDALSGAARSVAELRGSGAAFSPAGATMAYLAMPDDAVLRDARAALAGLSGQAAARQRQEIARLEAERARVMLRDVAVGPDREIRVPPMTRGPLVYTADGTLLMVGGAAPGAAAADRVARLTGEGAPAIVLEGAGIVPGPIAAARALHGPHVLLVYQRGGFGLLDTASGALRNFAGAGAAPSADGRHVVFMTAAAGETAIQVVDVAGDAAAHVVHRTRLPVASPALSPGGARVAFQMMPREDWEIFVVPVTGGEPVRVTREIQHDLQPHFLTEDTLLALMGEARHRRSYLYDLTAVGPMGDGVAARGVVRDAPGRTRLHHNNTIRTVAPEYEWIPSPDGRRVLIVADRDGDTISPERALVLMDLTTVIADAALDERLRVSLAGELALRAMGERAFRPMRTAVADAVAAVSTARISGYAHDLFRFDSKFITQPGNQKAIAYIAEKLRSWGYEPELQWFEARGVRTANIIAKLRGTVDPQLIYVVSSHFDSVERGPGADDDSSGTTALLEAARVMVDRPAAATIHFAFFTGEEAGLLGSREYVRRAAENGERIVGALNNDMIGFANDHRLDNTIRYSNAGIRDLQHAAAGLFTKLITYDAKYYRSTDAAAYYEAYGDIVGGIGSYPILGNPHYHQTHDVLETINQQLVAEVSKTTIATILLLASSPSRLTGLVVTQDGTQAAWAPAVESGVREYIVAWGPREDPLRDEERVREPRVAFRVRLAPGMVVSVKAVNAAGLESWDRARAEVR